MEPLDSTAKFMFEETGVRCQVSRVQCDLHNVLSGVTASCLEETLPTPITLPHKPGGVFSPIQPWSNSAKVALPPMVRMSVTTTPKPPDSSPLPVIPSSSTTMLPMMPSPCSAPTTPSSSSASKDRTTSQVKAGSKHGHGQAADVEQGHVHGGGPGEGGGHDTTSWLQGTPCSPDARPPTVGRLLSLRKLTVEYSADQHHLSSAQLDPGAGA